MFAIVVNAVDGLCARWISIPLAVVRLVQSRRVALLLIAVARKEDGVAGARSGTAPAAGQRTRREASGTRKSKRNAHGRNAGSFTPRELSNGCASSAATVRCDQRERPRSKKSQFPGKAGGEVALADFEAPSTVGASGWGPRQFVHSCCSVAVGESADPTPLSRNRGLVKRKAPSQSGPRKPRESAASGSRADEQDGASAAWF
jgi:hypothetical protein